MIAVSVKIYDIIVLVPLLIGITAVIVFYVKDRILGIGIGEDIVVSIERLLYGWNDKFINILLISAAYTQIFSPSLFVEAMYFNGVQILSIYFARIASFLISHYFWRQISCLGFQSISAYLVYRYDSKFIAIIYYINSLLTFAYLFIVYSSPAVYSIVEYMKTCSILFDVSIIVFLIICATGGMQMTLFCSLVVWLYEVCGHVTLVYKSANFFPRNISKSLGNFDECYTNVGVNEFFFTFSLLMSVQPGYSLFHISGPRKYSTISITIGLILFSVNSLLAFVWSLSVKNYSSHYQLSHYLWLYATMAYPEGMDANTSATFKEPFLGLLELDRYIEKIWDVDIFGYLIIAGPVMGCIISFLAIRLAILFSELGEILLPTLLQLKLITCGNDFHRLYTSFFTMFIACLMSMYYAVDIFLKYPDAINFSLFISHPFILLLPGVTLSTVIGCLLPRASALSITIGWFFSFVIFAIIVFSTIYIRRSYDYIFGHFVWENLRIAYIYCFAGWLTTCHFVSSIITCMLCCIFFSDEKKWYSVFRKQRRFQSLSVRSSVVNAIQVYRSGDRSSINRSVLRSRHKSKNS